MEKKEITIIDLVKIAARWIWILILGAVLCAGIAFFYSTQMVTPMYASSSKFVIQTKQEDVTSDILASQRGVAYAQLVVGTYTDILNTRDFAVEVAKYMNGQYDERKFTSEGVKNVINTAIRQAIFEDGGIIDGGKLDTVIDTLADSGFIDESYKNAPVFEAAKKLTPGAEALTDAKFRDEVATGLMNGKLIPEYVYIENQMFAGVSEADRQEIDSLRETLGNKEYDFKTIKGMIGFGTAEESTTFTLSVRSEDPTEAYAIARVCEIIIPGYIENRYPDSGLTTTIDSAVYNPSPTNNNTFLLVLVGFIGGFILAFVIVYIIELADNRVKNQEELAEKTGLSVMAIIPDTASEKNNSGAYTYGKNYK